MTGPDGSFYNLVSLSITPPTDSRYAGCRVIVKYTSGIHLNRLEEVADIPYPRTSVDVLWKPPAGSQTADWYFVSYNKLGQLNTIVDGITPKVSNTVGATSQFDFTQVKLSTISDQFRIDPLTGVPTIFQFSALLLTEQLQVGGGTLNGVCSTVNSGADTAVTKTSGDSFTSAMVGTYIYIHGTTVKVKTYTDASHIVVATNLGTHSGYNWSYGRPPQFKIFDRSNTEMGFWGDDSYNTGFVGLWAGRDVRLGGTISSPIFEVDPGGAVTIDGATVSLTKNSIITRLNNDVENLIPFGLCVSDLSGNYPTYVRNSSFEINETSTTQLRARLNATSLMTALELYYPSSTGGGAAISIQSTSGVGMLDPAGPLMWQLDPSGNQRYAGRLQEYDGKFTAAGGMGVAPIYAAVSATGQTASIGATNLQVDGGIAPVGQYRANVYLAATVAGSAGAAQINILYNDGIAARTDSFNISFGALSKGDWTLPIYTSGSSHIQYSVTYTGTGGAAYMLKLTLERLS